MSAYFPRLARRRPQLAAALVVLFLAASVASSIAHPVRSYRESATVLFSLPQDHDSPRGYYYFAASLITSEQAVIQVLTGPQGAGRLRASGGTDDISMQLANRRDDEYPDFAEPLATLTATAPTPSAAHRGFTAAARLVSQILASWQARAGVRRRNRITADIIGASGPVATHGSAVRMLAGLVLLGVITAAMAWRLAGRLRPAAGRPLAAQELGAR